MTDETNTKNNTPTPDEVTVDTLIEYVTNLVAGYQALFDHISVIDTLLGIVAEMAGLDLDEVTARYQQLLVEAGAADE